MKIGLIVAIEMDPIFAFYKNLEQLPCPQGFHLYKTTAQSNELYVLQTGMGEVAAAAGVQYLITGCGVEVIVNYGVVGGLIPEMKQQNVCVVDRVVHYKYDCSEFMDLAVGQVDGHDSVYLPTTGSLVEKALAVAPGLQKVTCCSGDKFVDTAEEKSHIHQAFDGHVCDMESSGIVLTCEINNVPCLLLKAVADSLQGGAGEFYALLQAASFKCLEIAAQIIATLDK